MSRHVPVVEISYHYQRKYFQKIRTYAKYLPVLSFRFEKKTKPLDTCNNVLMFHTGRQAMDLINDFFQF